MGIEGDRGSEMQAQSVEESLHMAAFLVKREWRKMWNNNHSEASDPVKLDMFGESVQTRKKQTLVSEVQNNLKQEILQLERRLLDQSEVRCGLERALGYKPSSFVDSNDIVMPEQATKLIKEIAVLELEVAYLEQHLLSMYRKAFDQQLSSVSPPAKDERLKFSTRTPSSFLEVSKPHSFSKAGSSAVRYNAHELETPATRDQYKGNGSKEKLFDSSVYRCPSTLSHSSAFTTRTSPIAESSAKAVCACHSQQLSMMEYPETASSSMISMAEHLGTRVFDHIPDTPNRISENMVKCISAIYCKLAEPPMTYHGISSPSSSFSSMSAFSVGEQGNIWSPGIRNNSFFDLGIENPFQLEGHHEIGPHSSMFEVSWIYRESLKLSDTENLLQIFRSLTCRLEEVDPGKLNHEEKLAFWINIHNSLVMHAFLAHGIPQNNVKRIILLLKAAYNVGGRTVSADTIQNTILGCRMSRPGQWVRLLFSPWTKLRSGGDRGEAYAIERGEPLLHFALCSGNHSDPAVRVYTGKRVVEELQVAKEEYIGTTCGMRKDPKMVVPKLVEAFAKESGLSHGGVIEMIQQCLPQSTRFFNKYHTPKSRKNIEWIPHNFTFRYLISKDLLIT